VVAVDVGREGVAAVQSARWLQENGIPQPDWLPRLPWVGTTASAWWQSHLADPGYATDLLGRLDRSVALEWTRILGTQVVHRLALFGFTLLTLFFLYRDGPVLERQGVSVAGRLFGAPGIRLGQQMVTAVRGTVNGLVLVGLGEGFILGLAYALSGVAHSLLLGAATAVLAMVPFGAPAVLGIATLMLLAEAKTVAAVTLLVFGSVVIFVADHFVRPYFIGGAARLPFLWVLLGILGGLEAFGLLGLFLGPAIMAALVELWRDWADDKAAHSRS
jgi:predicted PurR-regulated permease PerM